VRERLLAARRGSLSGALRHRPPAARNRAGPSDPFHSWADIHSEWNQGKMDGFYTTDGINALGYYEASDLPYYYSLLPTYALCAN
jgi:phospholipase C